MLKVYWVPSPKFTAGHPAPLIAIVNHRMVGTLASTDTTFTTGSRVASTNFGVGYGCGRAGHPATAHVHQYVRLGDQAWGNGNNKRTDGSLVPSKWNSRYPTTLVNSRTISIEHHDNGGAAAGHGRGVVPDAVQAVSIELQRLLIWNDVPTMKAAGIQFRAGTETAIGKELRALRANIDTHHIVDHNYIADGLKPYCWKPWADDPIGFPQSKYIAAIKATAPVPTPVPPATVEEIVKSFPVPKTPTLATVKTGAWLYVSSDFSANAANVQVNPGRNLPYLGNPAAGVRIVEYVDSQGTHSGKAYFVKDADVSGYVVPVAPADTTPYSQAQMDAAKTAANKSGFNEGLDTAGTLVDKIPRR